MTAPRASQAKPIDTGLQRKAKNEPPSSPQDLEASRCNGANIYSPKTELDRAFEDAMMPRTTATQGTKPNRPKTLIPIHQTPGVNNNKRSIQDLNNSGIEDSEPSTRSTSRGTSSDVPGLQSLRRSTRDAVPMSGPQSYSQKWHPVDVLENNRPRKKKPLKADARSTRVTAEVAPSKNPTTDDQQLVKEDLAPLQPYRLHEDITHPDRRRSARVTYSEATSLSYDLKHHPSYDNFHRPITVAKRLEKKRQSMLVPSRPQTPILEGPTIKDVYCDEEPIQRSYGRCRERSLQCDGSQPCRSCEDDGIDVDGCTNGEQRASSLPTEGEGERLLYGTDIVDDSYIIQPDDMMEEGHVPLRQLSPSFSPSKVRSPMLALGDNLKHSPEQCSLQNEIDPPQEPKPVDWTQLSPFDRRLYLMQKGASAKGDALPVKWSTVKQILSNEGLLPDSDFGTSSRKIESMLEDRYETIRLGVESFFKAKPEPLFKNDWELYRVEGLDVYGCRKGVRYFKHIEDSIVKAVTTTTEATIHGGGEVGSHETDNSVDKPCPQARLLNGHTRQKPSMVSKMILTVGIEDTTLLDDLMLPERSTKRSVDLMARSKPTVSQRTQDMNPQELEAFLNILSAFQTDSPPAVTIPQPQSSSSSHVHFHPATPTPSPRPPIKRRRRPAVPDRFSIFEDDDDEDGNDLYNRRKRLEQISPKSDHPVENMVSQWDLAFSQSGGMDLTPRHGRNRAGGRI